MFKVLIFFIVIIFENVLPFERVEYICSTQHVKRIFLGVGEFGVGIASNITVNKENTSDAVGFPKRCHLEILTCSFCAVSLTFTNMNLNCNCKSESELNFQNPYSCDFVEITEPPYEEQSRVTLCKIPLMRNVSARNSVYTSKTRAVRISFYYSFADSQAFKFYYISKLNRQVFYGTYDETENSSYSQGIISSPFFPASYPRDLVNEYVINCATDHFFVKLNHTNNKKNDDLNCRIYVIFTDFLLAPASELEFLDGEEKLEIIKGSEFRPPAIISSSNSVTIRFRGNGQKHLGFKASYYFLSKNTLKTTFKPRVDCGGIVDNFGGTITMINMVKNNVQLFDCVWLIQPSKNLFNPKTHLYLKITSFLNFVDTAEIQIRKGRTSESPLLQSLRYPSKNIDENVIPIKFGYYVSLRGIFSPSSQLAITYASFSYNSCFIWSDYFCRNSRCISKKLSCDGFDHCGDNSDEPKTCYQEWLVEPTVGRWYTQLPNYYFPKLKTYLDFKAETLLFFSGLTIVILLMTTLTVVIYRVGSKRQSTPQEEFHSVSEFIDSLSDEIMEDIVIDNPPCYESPPHYEDVIKLENVEPSLKEEQIKL